MVEAAVIVCLAIIAVALIVTVITDVRHFEIHFEALGVASAGGLLLMWLLSGWEMMMAAVSMALTLGVVAEIMRQCRPRRMGAGDPWAFAALGLYAGPDYLLPVLVVCALMSIIAASVYSLRRGKTLFQSAFPAAVALVPSMFCALFLRVQDAYGHSIIPVDRMKLLLSFDASLHLFLISSSLLVGFWLGTKASRQSLHSYSPRKG
ncbi:MAG: hypothetical protein OXC62_06380 [Aestuariivita sp.]|nr:hypothetical protein [Aestuariivita sp.]